MRVEGLTKSEAQALKSKLKQPYRLIWDIGSSTGLRISDILSLRVKDIQGKRKTIREKKTGKSRTIYIRDSVKKEAAEYVAGKKLNIHDKLFTVNRSDVWRSFKLAAKAAGIKKRVGTHTMRKTYALHYIGRADTTIKDLQKRLNHNNMGDTIGYIYNGR